MRDLWFGVILGAAIVVVLEAAAYVVYCLLRYGNTEGDPQYTDAELDVLAEEERRRGDPVPYPPHYEPADPPSPSQGPDDPVIYDLRYTHRSKRRRN